MFKLGGQDPLSLSSEIISIFINIDYIYYIKYAETSTSIVAAHLLY